MSTTLTGRLTAVASTDAEYAINLAGIQADPYLTIVSQDATTKTIVYDVNVTG